MIPGCPYSGPYMIAECPYSGLFMIPDWSIFGSRLDHRSLWFQVDHTLNHIRFQIDHGKMIEKNCDLYFTIYNQRGNPGCLWIKN